MILRTQQLRNSTRHGLTLLELVVVLAILAALAGIVVPLLPNLMHRATVSTCTTNLGEIGKLVQTYQALNSSMYPDKLDNLVENGTSNLATYVLNGSLASPSNTWFAADKLGDDEVAALNQAGITQTANLVDQPTPVGDWSPTFWPYGSSRAIAPNFTPLSTLQQVAVINATGMNELTLPSDNGERYVIFGLNAPCTLFRNLAEEPPYLNPDHPGEDPSTYYKCFGLVFLVSYDNPVSAAGTKQTAPLAAAKFVGPVGFDHDGPATTSAQLSSWYQQAHADQANQ